MSRPHLRRARSGFTMVELLVVIAVISILIALLVPAVTGAVRKARDAQVAAEIQTLAQSLQSFKTKYGDFPPSRIFLSEDGVLTDARALRYMRKFFPRALFSPTPWPANVTPPWYDFNGNGTGNGNPSVGGKTEQYTLEGHECLVFFLGGIPTHTGAGVGTPITGMGGFASNPTNPFVSENSVPSPRQRPLFEFKADRLIDEDGDDMPGYLDSLGTGADGRPYVYFSAYGGNGYDPGDEDRLSQTRSATLGPVSPDDYDSAANQPSSQYFTGVNTTLSVNPSPAPNPYTIGVPNGKNTPQYVNPESYQIISAGKDRIYGVGGQYDAKGSGDKLPYTYGGAYPDVANIRAREQDNLTNFSTGTLD